MAITTLDQVNTLLPAAQRADWYKVQPTGTVSAWYSAWTVAGGWGQGVAPSSGLAGDVPTDATAGGFFFRNPGGTDKTHIARVSSGLGINGSGAGSMLAIYDRLWHNSGLSATSTGAQTINSVALTRPDANGAGVEAWWEVYATMGAGTPDVTLTYTNQAGTGSKQGTSGTMSTTMALGRAGQFSMASGDSGVRSIQTWQASATFSSGTIGLVLRRLVVAVPLKGGGLLGLYDAIALGLPRVYDDACLEPLLMAASGNQPYNPFSMSLVQG